MVEFSNYPRKLFDFNRFPNQATLINALGHVPYMGGQAMLGKALKYSAVKLFSRSPRKKVAIVVTGKSLDSVAGPARDLRRAGVKVVSVGIGVYSVPQLQQMATNKRSVFATKFKTLNNIVRAIKQKASKALRPVPRPLPVRPRPGGRRPYRFIGTYKVPPRKYLGRAIPIKNPTYGRIICERIARRGRYRAFAVRGGRQCFVSRSSPRKFMVYGRTRSRKPGRSIRVYIRSRGWCYKYCFSRFFYPYKRPSLLETSDRHPANSSFT
ncbi:collagen alpha-1(XXI) chain-like [Orbicella faveolata]|uniref:collagen alpha-1(XXI) chain-like n=1 Tax=Orbicella faveolata TaxID=48498 RepID=UPI0009E5FA2F|nr:collagen alpha-1(XXI) chain-like [Orbicella faveolata]XP_020622486.1 collagen alpha-1(XXI) chain-like [Orbicella faveolata]